MAGWARLGVGEAKHLAAQIPSGPPPAPAGRLRPGEQHFSRSAPSFVSTFAFLIGKSKTNGYDGYRQQAMPGHLAGQQRGIVVVGSMASFNALCCFRANGTNRLVIQCPSAYFEPTFHESSTFFFHLCSFCASYDFFKCVQLPAYLTGIGVCTSLHSFPLDVTP